MNYSQGCFRLFLCLLRINLLCCSSWSLWGTRHLLKPELRFRASSVPETRIFCIVRLLQFMENSHRIGICVTRCQLALWPPEHRLRFHYTCFQGERSHEGLVFLGFVCLGSSVCLWFTNSPPVLSWHSGIHFWTLLKQNIKRNLPN